MIDFSKIFCNLHPQQLITNFCNKDQCLVGLCASCICIHTQSHMQKSTSPDYQNIRLTYKKVQDRIKIQLQLFEKDKQRIDQVCSRVVGKRAKVKETIYNMKEKVSYLLGDYFQRKQKEMLREIEAQEKKYGLHCENRLDGLRSNIARQVSNLTAASEELSSRNFLQSLPRIRTQNLINSQKTQNQIQEQIEQNQNFKTQICYEEQYLAQLTKILDRSIQITSSGPSTTPNSKNNTGSSYYTEQKKLSKILNRPASQGHTNSKRQTQENGFSGFNFSSNRLDKSRNAESYLAAYDGSNKFQFSNGFKDMTYGPLGKQADGNIGLVKEQDQSSKKFSLSNGKNLRNTQRSTGSHSQLPHSVTLQTQHQPQQGLKRVPQQMQQYSFANPQSLPNFNPSPNLQPRTQIQPQLYTQPFPLGFPCPPNPPAYTHNQIQPQFQSQYSRSVQKPPILYQDMLILGNNMNLANGGLNFSKNLEKSTLKKNKKSGLKVYANQHQPQQQNHENMTPTNQQR